MLLLPLRLFIKINKITSGVKLYYCLILVDITFKLSIENRSILVYSLISQFSWIWSFPNRFSTPSSISVEMPVIEYFNFFLFQTFRQYSPMPYSRKFRSLLCSAQNLYTHLFLQSQVICCVKVEGLSTHSNYILK